MRLDLLATRGGQLFGAYVLVAISLCVMLIDRDAGKSMLTLLVGAILRDMQDTRAALNTTNNVAIATEMNNLK